MKQLTVKRVDQTFWIDGEEIDMDAACKLRDRLMLLTLSPEPDPDLVWITREEAGQLVDVVDLKNKIKELESMECRKRLPEFEEVVDHLGGREFIRQIEFLPLDLEKEFACVLMCQVFYNAICEVLGIPARTQLITTGDKIPPEPQPPENEEAKEPLHFLSEETKQKWNDDFQSHLNDGAGDATDRLKEGEYIGVGDSLVVRHEGKIIIFGKQKRLAGSGIIEDAEKAQSPGAEDPGGTDAGAGSQMDPQNIKFEAQTAIFKKIRELNIKLHYYFGLS